MIRVIREYDLFEKFPDGSSLWRASILGLQGTQLHLRHLAGKSENTFYAMDVTSGKIVACGIGRVAVGNLAPRKLEKSAKSAVA